MNILVPLPIALPLFAAGLSTALVRQRRAQRLIGLAVNAALVLTAIALLIAVERDGPVAVQMGGWEAPLGITLVVDRLSALMLVVSTTMVLIVLVYAIGELGDERESLFFHPVYLVLNAGVSASFLTGDLFNLFVAFEVMLIASYVLITLGGERGQLRAGMTYVVINLVASTFFVVALALVYASTGTVNMADLAGKLAELDPSLRRAIGLLLLTVFGIKAGMFPLYFWLPDSYPVAPAPVTALFAGLLTKVGVYTILRSQTLLFADAGEPSTLLLFLAGGTMLAGVLGAISQNDMGRILSFLIVSGVGFTLFGLGLFTSVGLAGAIFYIVQTIIIITSMFLIVGIIENTMGSGTLSGLAGYARRNRTLSLGFLVGGLSMAGLPPFSGFVGKLALVQGGLAEDRLIIVAVSLLASLLTLFAVAKIWSDVFWGEQEPSADFAGAPVSRLMRSATGALVGMGLLAAAFAGPLYAYTVRTAEDLLRPERYIETVLPPSVTARAERPSQAAVQGS
ncbi:MAG: proton-conducting transporter membrane subunit [Egibacteraceae bacterium]